MSDEFVLALDTASATVSVAVHDGSQVVAECAGDRPGKHAEQLTPLIGAVLGRAGITRGDLSAVVAGVGPGPFTGLRVGLVTAAVLGLALDIPVRGVCSLDAIALGAAADPNTPEQFVAAMDARRREVYWARYELTRIAGVRVGVRSGDPQVGAPTQVPAPSAVAGRGALLYPEALGEMLPGPVDPGAGALAVLAGLDPRFVLPPEPLYLRRPDAQANPGRKRVLT